MMERTNTSFWSRAFGDRAFVRMAMGIVLPIIAQNGLTMVVSLLDNIMVGQLNTEAMSGVSIANQLMLVFNLTLFGAMGGAGVFTAQFFGKDDMDGVRKTVRYKSYLGALLSVIAAALFLINGEFLISLYLRGEGTPESIAQTLRYGTVYLRLILLSFPAFLVLQVLASTLRECGETVVPMNAGITAIATNLVMNYLLIFGKLGFPQMGVNGAAVATVISRYVEALIVLVWTCRHKQKQPWVSGLFATFKIPFVDVKRFFLRGSPLLVNELLYSFGFAMCTQCYSLYGIAVVAALNISNNLVHLANMIHISMGTAVGIIIGRMLGAGEMDTVKDADDKLIRLALLMSTVAAVLVLAAASFFPQLYQTDAQTKALATQLITISAFFIVINAYLNCVYFTMRAGGRTLITFFFDSVSIWVIMVPTAYCLVHFTQLPITTAFLLVNLTDFIKVGLGYILIRKGVWINNIVNT